MKFEAPNGGLPLALRARMAFPQPAGLPADGASFRPPIRSEVTLRALPRDFIERQRARVAGSAAQVPTGADDFVGWFRDLKDAGPGQSDPLFEFLAERASLFEMRWFLNQEVGGEHAPRLDSVARALGLDGSGAVHEARLLRRLIAVLREEPRYAFQCAGALAVTALTAPERAAAIRRGVQRLGLGGGVRGPAPGTEFDVESLRALVQARREHAAAIAEGALMRLEAGARCWKRYRRELGFVEPLERRVMILAEDRGDQNAPILPL